MTTADSSAVVIYDPGLVTPGHPCSWAAAASTPATWTMLSKPRR